MGSTSNTEPWRNQTKQTLAPLNQSRQSSSNWLHPRVGSRPAFKMYNKGFLNIRVGSSNWYTFDMKHIIVHLVRGEAKEYHESLTKDLVEKFDVFPIHERIPPHLTLKRWFEVSDRDMQLLHNLLDGYTATHTPSGYDMNQFSNFREDVLFLDVEPSEKMQRDVLELMDALHTHPSLEFDEYDNGSDFHATLTMRALKEFDFHAIRNYLDASEPPNFKMKFDNIAILKKPETEWVVDRVWELQT